MAKKGRIRRNSYFNTLFWPNILIIAVVISVLFCTFYIMLSNNIRNEIIAYNMQYVEHSRANFESRLKECRNIAAQISNNSKLRYTNMKKPYGSIEGINELIKYMAGNSFFSDLFILYKDDELLYSAYGTTLFDVVLRDKYHLSEEDITAFRDYVRSGRNLTKFFGFYSSDSWIDNNAPEVLFYISPILVDGSFQNGISIFVIDKKTACTEMNSENYSFGGYSFIIDDNHILVASDSNGNVCNAGIFYPSVLQTINGYSVMILEGKEYSVLMSQSDTSTLQYVTAVQSNLLLSRVISIRTIIISVSVSVLLLGIILAYWIASHTYRPIDVLNQMIKDNRLESIDNNSNEIENIRHAVQHTLTANQSLIDKLEYEKEQLRGYLLMMLLKTSTNSTEYISKLANEAEMDLHGPLFAVLAIGIDDENVSRYNNLCMDFIISEYSGKGIGYAIEMMNEGVIAIVVNLDENGEREIPLHISEQIKSLYLERFGINIRIGIGKPYKEIIHICNSFAEALIAVTYKSDSELDPSSFFSDLITVNCINPISSLDSAFITSLIMQGNYELVKKSLADSVFAVRQKSSDNSSTRFYCYRILDSVMKATDFSETAAADQESLKSIAGLFTKAMNCPDLESFEEIILKLAYEICELNNREIDLKEEKFKSHVINFIESEFRNPNFSLESLTEKFGFSVYYWSRFFKEKIKCLFSDYLWSLRSSEAKKLLKETDLSVKDIVSSVGYFDTTAFIRRFKSCEGITPGQYRKIYRNGAADTVKP